MTYKDCLRSMLLFVCLAAACKKNSNNHLPPKKMEQILLDITVAEIYSSNGRESNHFGGVKNTDSLAVFYQDIFSHYHITQQEFAESMAWYKDHPDDLDSIYSSISAKTDKLLNIENNKRVKILQTSPMHQ